MASYKELFSWEWVAGKWEEKDHGPEWDTGYCRICTKPLEGEDRTTAIWGTLHHGQWLYAHQWCFDLRHHVFISRAEAEERWADKILEDPSLLEL